MIKETKDTKCNYYQDTNGSFQGEAKSWYDNGQPRVQRFYKDGRFHGESKYWERDGELSEHLFYQDNAEITEEVKASVVDILNITKEERMMIKLKFGIECLT